MTLQAARQELEAYVTDCQTHPEQFSLGKLRALEDQFLTAWRWLNESGPF